MKTFKQFIAEMPYLVDYKKTPHQIKTGKMKIPVMFNYENDDHVEKKPSTANLKKTVSTHKGYKIIKDEGGYHALNSKTKRIDMSVWGKEKNKKFTIKSLAGREGSKIKADDMYAHLANRHKLTVHSDIEQSKGASKVWKKLSNRPDVNVGRQDQNRIPMVVHKDKDWDKNYGNTTRFVLKGKK